MIRIQGPEKAERIVRDAGGEVVGRTRLQKIAYLLELTRLGDGFQFEYRHYGPYSEQLATALSTAKLSGIIQEDERITDWGGSYSVYRSKTSTGEGGTSPRRELIDVAASADPVALELAATAAFLAAEGVANPWAETVRRKPEKADRLANAKELYGKLREIRTPVPLPAIIR